MNTIPALVSKWEPIVGRTVEKWTVRRMHLHERTHDEHLIAMLDEYMPNWRALRDQLNHAPLAHEEWSA